MYCVREKRQQKELETKTNITVYNWMKSSRAVERLTANVNVATVLGSIPASSDTVESELQQVLNTVHKKNPKKSPCLNIMVWVVVIRISKVFIYTYNCRFKGTVSRIIVIFLIRKDSF
jgi:hypothetical protein